MKKSVAYARFSSDNQRQESIDAQVRAIQEYCSKNDIQLTKIYQDEAMSATNDQREQFLQMIDDAKKHEFEYIIVHKLDRFARNRYDSAFYKRDLRNNGVKIISVLEHLDDSPESIILESVLEGMAEYYSMNLAREVRKGMNENALKAVHNGGIPPLGYDVVNGQYFINEKEAEIVRLIFKLHNDGLGYTRITDKLNSLGYKTKIGRDFGVNSLFDLVRNEKYTGVYIFNKRESKKTGNRKFKPDDQIVRIEGAIPEIITKEVWERSQKKLDQKNLNRVTDTREYILRGFIKCGECGGSYVGGGYVKRKDADHYIYNCSKRTRNKTCSNKPVYASYLEAYVVDYIIGHFMSDEFISKLASDMNKATSEKKHDDMQDYQRITKQLAQNKIKETKLWDLYYGDLLDKVAFADQLKKNQSEADELSSMLEKINQTKVPSQISNEAMVSFLLDLKDKIRADSQETKKLLIEAFLQEIVIYNDRFDLFFKEWPSSKPTKGSAQSGGSEGSRTPVQIASTFNLLQFSLRW